MFGMFKTIVTGFSGGVVISGAVFAFIAIIGIVPRLAEKTRTTNKIILYEEAIIFGGIFGTLTMFFTFNINLGYWVAPLAGAIGIFYGCLAVSLAEVLDVIPILLRRGKFSTGITIFMLALAIGKLVGSLLYFLVPGFYTN